MAGCTQVAFSLRKGDIATDGIVAHFGVHVWDPKVDKLARQLPMDATLKRCMLKALRVAKVGSSALPSSPWPVTQPKARAIKQVKVLAPVLQIVQSRPVVKVDTSTDLTDGRLFGKKIVTIRRKQGKRACQHIGKRLLVIAGRNVGRGQVFYLSAAYGVMESR